MKAITICMLMVVPAAGGPRDPSVSCFRLEAPSGGSVNQASDLHFGALGGRKGLWVVSDRNGGPTAGRIFFMSTATLKAAKPGEAIRCDEEFAVTPPTGEWADFAAANRAAGTDTIEDVRRRISPGQRRDNEPFLDLEAITIAPSPAPPHDPHLFVVTEEPYSTVLELAVEGEGKTAQARLVAWYGYRESSSERGTAINDGLEGLAWTGRPGEFYFAEEGTKPVDCDPKALLFFLDPRFGLARFEHNEFVVDTSASDALTEAVREERDGKSQTLNGLAVLPDGRVLAVDRNGGWILRIDPRKRTAERWLNLYGPPGLDLRHVLAGFPKERQMPYVSIEGIAVDDDGAIWLCDDPAIPEGWRESCLVRVAGARTNPSR